MATFTENPVVYISDLLLNIINNVDLGSLLKALEPLAGSIYTLLLIYVGLRLILGYGDAKELLTNIIKIIFIATILYAADYGFQQFMVPGIKGLRTFLVDAMNKINISNAEKNPDIYALLDDLLTKGQIISNSALDKFSIRSFVTYPYGLLGLITLLVTIVLVVLMTFSMLGAEIIMLLLFAIGPIFVISFLFTSTRNFFFLWISATLSNILLFTICSFFVALSLNIINKTIDDNKIIDVLTASKNLNALVNETIIIEGPPGDWSGGMTKKGNQKVEDLKNERDKKIEEIEISWDKEKRAKKAEIGCTFCYNEPEIEEINNKFKEKISSLNKEYDIKIKNEEDKKAKTISELKEFIDKYPVTFSIYLGIIFLLAILIKITSEIPEIARTLSGGMGAGASAAALAHQGIGMAKSAAIGAITGVAGASYAALKWAKNKASPPPSSPMQQMLEKVDTLSTQVQQQTALLERFDPRPAQPHPEPTPAPQLDGDPSPKPRPAEETKPGKIKNETHIAAPQDPQNAPEPAATPPQPSQLAEEKGQGATEAETGKTVGNDSNKIDSPEKADVNVNTHVDADVIAKGGRNSGGDGGSPNNGLPSNAAHGASGIGGAIDSAQRESAQQQSQTGSNTQPSTPATSGGSGSKGTPSASNSTTPPAPQNEKKPSITDPKGNKPPKEPPIKKL